MGVIRIVNTTRVGVLLATLLIAYHVTQPLLSQLVDWR